MRVLETLEGAKNHFLARVHLTDGRVLLHTGADWSGWAARHGAIPRHYADRYIPLGLDRVSLGPTIVFEAALRHQGKGVFVDRDDGARYTTSQPETVRILDAAVQGRLGIEDGHVVGRFTFALVGRKVRLALTPERPGGAKVPDAPDLSDFVRTLGAPDPAAL